MLNHEVNVKIGKGIPQNANYEACQLDLPAGENYSPNNFFSILTNENYTWHYNSNGVHFISRINGDTGECEIVFEGECLSLSADPKHQITQFRGYMKYDKLCANRHGKYLVWVDGRDIPIGYVDVEASINTNFFTTPFFDLCPSPCAYLQLCVPEPQGCLVGDYVAFSDADKGLPNKLVDRGLKFMYRHVYYDLRASEWSDRSSLYFQDARGCFDSSEGFSRCIKFRIPIGNPMVDKIEFAFSEDGGLTWFLSETIDKYKKYNSSQQYWYERDLSELVSSTYSDTDCSFDYIFCNDKQRVSIDPLQVSRVFNPMPRAPQALLPMPKETLGFFNYLKGNCPIDKHESDKVSVTLNCNNAATSCDQQFAKLTVRAIIYADLLAEGLGIGGGGYIFRDGGSYGALDDPDDTAWFGVGHQFLDQKFNGEPRNFIPYIEGTNYWGEMEQWRSAPNFTSKQKVGVLSGLSEETTKTWLTNDVLNGNFYYQEYIFTVPKGMKGFVRLVSHHQESGVGTNQNTSTQVSGMLGVNGLKTYNGVTQVTVDETVKEMYFDTCNGDWDSFDAFVVNDVYYGDETGYSGYITDINELPVEGALVYAGATYRRMTDFNGFYFFHDPSGTITINVKVEQACAVPFSTIGSFSAQSDADSHQMARLDYEIQSLTYRDYFYANVDVPVKDCDNVPIRGVRVAMSGSKYKVTDSGGIAHFKLRNYTTRTREVVAVVMDKGGCFIVDCNDNCNPCMPSTTQYVLDPCFLDTPTYTLTPTTNVNISNINANRKGLKHGGRYPLGWVGKGNCGIITAVNEIGYFDIPSVQKQGNLSFCSFDFDMGNINLPLGITEVAFVRGANINPYNLQWIVDEIDRTSDGKIKLTIQSLNDYNASFFFKTNTVYKWLAGDRIEFIRNGDNEIFSTVKYGELNYLTLSPFNDEAISGVTDEADYFNQLLINDDGKLDGLVKGAIIELQTPSIATNEITYFDFCAKVPVVNGLATIQTGNFTTFDTFLVSRQIGKNPAQLFEHKSPSDFWGETTVDGLSIFLSDIGKVHFVNKYENERRFGRNISVNSPTQFNYFGDFEKTFDSINHGDLIALFLKDEKIGLAISENDNSLFRVNDDLLRVGSDNIVRAVPVDNLISDPEPKLRGEFGCSYADIGSILSGDGFATFISAKNDVYIIHDYSSAKPTGTSLNEQGMLITQCHSYFKKRIREKENFNRTSTDFLNHIRYATGINKNTGVVYLTIKSLRDSGINNGKAVYELRNETIMYNPINDNYLGFCSFTPEGYSQLNLNTEDGCSFLTYIKSVPYIHPVIADKFNEFFGQACDWLVGISVNAENKIIVPISYEGQSSTKFFIPKFTTDKPTFLSEVPPVKVKQLGNKWNASFLNDVNSRGGLYSGSNARGYFVDVLFCRDNTIDNQYLSINDAKRKAYSELDEILVKFMLVEQSAFTMNV